MTEREYTNLCEHLRQLGDAYMSELSKEQFQRIWKVMASGEVKPVDHAGLMHAALRAKGRLLQYVQDEGPFVFEDGRCLFIDVAAFELADWQWPRIPVRDVTHLAQRGFRTEYDSDKRAYIYRNRHGFTLIALAVSAFLALSLLPDSCR